MSKPKTTPLTFAQRQARDNAQILNDVIEAGGRVNVRFDLKRGARVRVNLDRIEPSLALAMYLRYTNADKPALVNAACTLMSAHLKE